VLIQEHYLLTTLMVYIHSSMQYVLPVELRISNNRESR